MDAHFWIRVYVFLYLWKPGSIHTAVHALDISSLVMGISRLQREQSFPLVSAPRPSAHWMTIEALPLLPIPAFLKVYFIKHYIRE